MSWSGRRDWMILMRKRQRMNLEQMAANCLISEKLLGMVEAGAITHPDIASRIARAYGMDVHQYNELVHPDRQARVLPAWKNPPHDRKFTWCKYYNEHVARSEAV